MEARTMSEYTRSMLRLFGALGAGLAVMGTFVAWYDFDVVITGPPIAHMFIVPVDLWSLHPLAATLLLVGAVVSLVLVSVPALAARRFVGMVAGLLGLGITVYAAIRCFDIPHLGVRDAASAGVAGAVQPETTLDGGPFLTLTGGAMLVLGSLPVLLASADRSRAFARGAGATPAAT
jgi:hypothetical protein